MGIGFVAVEKPMSQGVFFASESVLRYFYRICVFAPTVLLVGEPFVIQQVLPKANGVICDIDFSNCPTINSLDCKYRMMQKVYVYIFCIV